MSGQTSIDDLVQPFQVDALGVRGRLVRLGPALEAVLGGHDYPPPVAGMLAETLSLAAVLASGLKYDGVFSLQTQGDGPLGLMLADVTSEGDLRGYVRFEADRVEAAAKAAGGPVPRLLGAGHMAFTVDQGPDTERYQGITGLEGATMADCAHTYFRQSEQMETAISLAATPDAARASGKGAARDPDAPARAAALMIQRLPAQRPSATQGNTSLIDDDEVDDEHWRRAVVLMSTTTPDELLDPGLAPRELLYRLYHQEGVRVYRTRPLRHACRCSRAKVEVTLASFPRSEVEDMATDEGTVVVTCEFCKATYAFDPADVEALYAP